MMLGDDYWGNPMQKLMPVICIGLMLLGVVVKTDKSATASGAKSSSQRSEAEKKAIAAIKKLGGTVTVDEKKPGKPVTVILVKSKITDAGLVHLKYLTKLQNLYLGGSSVTDAGLVHLKGLTKLQELTLGETKITDAGLVHLKRLTKLKLLDLAFTKVSDAGLVHLKGLTNLQGLYLSDTKVTDAGLVHLKGLTKLQGLDLNDSKVTATGVKKLQAALPKCEINWMPPNRK